MAVLPSGGIVSAMVHAGEEVEAHGAKTVHMCDSRTVVLNLGLIEPQGSGESISEVPWQEILSNKSKKKIHNKDFIFPTTNGSMNACMMYGPCEFQYLQQG